MALTSRATRVLQWMVQRDAESQDEADPSKAIRSPDWSLQLDSMKLESLVIANQKVAVNSFSDFVHTARHATEASCILK